MKKELTIIEQMDKAYEKYYELRGAKLKKLDSNIFLLVMAFLSLSFLLILGYYTIFLPVWGEMHWITITITLSMHIALIIIFFKKWFGDGGWVTAKQYTRLCIATHTSFDPELCKLKSEIQEIQKKLVENGK